MRRFNLQVDEKTLKRLQKMPHGFRSQIVRRFLVMLVDTWEQNGPIILGDLLEGDYELVPKTSPDPKAVKSRRARK